MHCLRSSLLALSLLTPSLALAEHPAGTPHDAPGGEAPEAHHAEHEPRVKVDFTTVLGRYDEGPSNARTRFFVSSGLLSATWKPAPDWAAVVLVPLIGGSIEEPGKEKEMRYGLGNLSLAVLREFHLGAETKLPVELLVALPTARGDVLSGEEAIPAGLDEAAAAVRGYEDDELFLPHRLTVVPKVEIEHEVGPVELSAYGKLPLLFRVGGVQEIPGAKTSPLAIDAVFTGQAMFHVAGHGHEGVSMGARVIYDVFVKELVERDPPLDETKTQLVVEPRVGLRLGAVHARAGYLLPIGGRGHEANARGLRLGVGASF